MQVYEVFMQEREGEPMRHAGNLRAPDDALALHYAREFYSRRGESIRLWVAPRATIVELADQDLLRPPLDRSYRVPAGYRINEKLDAARRRVAASTARRAAGESEAAATVTGERDDG